MSIQLEITETRQLMDLLGGVVKKNNCQIEIKTGCYAMQTQSKKLHFHMDRRKVKNWAVVYISIKKL